MPLEAIIFVTESPDFRIEDGLVHITQHVSDQLCVERVMRYNLFLRTIANAQRAVREYEARGMAEVIDFPKKASGTH